MCEGLRNIAWPGNVRELAERHRAGGHPGAQRPGPDRSAGNRRLDRCRTARPANGGGKPSILTEDERRDRDRANILSALEACDGKVFGRGGAAELLDLKPTTLASRIKTLGIRLRTHANFSGAQAEPRHGA